MTVPRLEVFLNQETALCIAKVERDNGESRVIVEVPMDELRALEPGNAAYRIGGTVLNILRLWHKSVFENWETPGVMGDFEGDDDYEFALRLINHALSTKTSVHNASIEFLLKQAATRNEDARKYLQDAWPVLRDRLEKSKPQSP